MEHVLDKQWLVTTARRVGFIQRSTSRLEGDDFVKLLTTEILALPAISLPGMCDVLRKINPAADMSPQALGERINNDVILCETISSGPGEYFFNDRLSFIRRFRDPAVGERKKDEHGTVFCG